MNKLTFLLPLVLVGCGHTVDLVKPEVVIAKRVEYVIRIPPAESLSLPPAAPKIDVDTALQSDVATWLVSSEERTKALEDKLISISTFFKTEQEALAKKAEEENKKSDAEAIKAQADATNAALNKPIQK
jgi:uncharacterized protein YjaG (DUF416 family)